MSSQLELERVLIDGSGRVRRMPLHDIKCALNIAWGRVHDGDTAMPVYRYEIMPRPASVGGGWQLRLLEDDVEIGGGVFPASTDEVDRAAAYDSALAEAEAWLAPRELRTPDEAAGIAWWNRLTEAERAQWLAVAGSAVPADAWVAYKRQTGGPAIA